MFPLSNDLESKKVPDVTYFLLFILFIVCLYQSSLPTNFATAFVNNWGFTPARLFNEFGLSSILTLVTAIFLHSGWSHFLNNAVVLFLLGGNVEENFGRLKYLAFYIIGGIVANLAQAYFGGDPTVACIGASGAISAVIGAYLVLYPESQITIGAFSLMFGFAKIKLPAFLVILIWYVIQFEPLIANVILKHYSMTANPLHVAYCAHIGGFLFGAIGAFIIGNKDDIKQPTKQDILKANEARWTKVR